MGPNMLNRCSNGPFAGLVRRKDATPKRPLALDAGNNQGFGESLRNCAEISASNSTNLSSKTSRNGLLCAAFISARLHVAILGASRAMANGTASRPDRIEN